jgi:hypothetical protein
MSWGNAEVEGCVSVPAMRNMLAEEAMLCENEHVALGVVPVLLEHAMPMPDPVMIHKVVAYCLSKCAT